MAIEPIILFLAVLAVIAVYYVLKTAKYLIVNTIMGLILLAAGNVVFNLGIPYEPMALLVCALGGIPGALLVILLNVLNIAFL
ncbi:MAG: pro-sigmaK processing inhibitor BofA family protein [Euryarchaeota archaeon]|nr:pro-sigmaK processing inhibitor BofA family protein [Euryarchaeota archaeon]MBU4220776.1 pro-sigmaK processing inhibitor BofA family protein [Euryarchaeota archaeon]MCG2736434.1 pro-sigmaK processing inhibitor BofA family protein [Candidatus Methanoperedenaceae archaeon]MDP3105983.1 pro-sigmaK processing inhibitor BofA family protein [Candidatus Methanoperedens sp.]